MNPDTIVLLIVGLTGFVGLTAGLAFGLMFSKRGQ